MSFSDPEWFLMIVPLAFVGWYWRGLKLETPLRLGILLLMVLTLAGPQLSRLRSGMDLWVLFDRSESAVDAIDGNIREWKRLIERSRPGGGDRVIYLDYAKDVLAQETAGVGRFQGDRSMTQTGLALQHVLSQMDSERPARVLLFTDGYSTESLQGLSEGFEVRDVALDYRLAGASTVSDYQVTVFEMPDRAQRGEAFVMEVEVTGGRGAVLPLQIYRNGNSLGIAEIAVKDGKGSVRFNDRIEEAGSHQYEVRIQPEDDKREGNDHRHAWIEVVSGPRVLLISKYVDDPLVPVLEEQGFAVERVAEPRSLQVGQLTGCRLVILNNVPAVEVPREFVNALDFFVREQGGGFLMGGGRYSFGSGGYFQSGIDPLLPVSMELKKDHRKLAVAMAIVMDRSGSMAASVAGLAGGMLTKMDLANDGAATAIGLLGERDLVSVHAVDSGPHRIVPLMEVGPSRKKILSLVRKIESTGGGIYVYSGLKAAWDDLKKADIGQRHIILFSDAADSEEPGDYLALMAEIVANSGSVSVIGLGTPLDSDAAFLEDVAKRGNGRMFFASDASELPSIFAQETVMVARSAFLKDPVATQVSGNWHEISGADLEWLNEIDAYNLSYLRQGDASAALLSSDEYEAPLVAWSLRGLGRTGAISFPLGGEHSERVRQWPQYGDFLQTMVRWLAGDEMPAGLALRTQLRGTELTADLFYEGARWESAFAQKAPRFVISGLEGSQSVSEWVWRRTAPGHYQLSGALPEGKVTRGAVQAGAYALPFGPMMVGGDAEWSFDADRLSELKELSESTEGRNLLSLDESWRRPAIQQPTSIRDWFMVAILALLVLEALATRLKWQMPELANLWSKRPSIRLPERPRRSKVKSKPLAKPVVEDPPPTPMEEKEETTPGVSDRRSRFERAKRR